MHIHVFPFQITHTECLRLAIRHHMRHLNENLKLDLQRIITYRSSLFKPNNNTDNLTN